MGSDGPLKLVVKSRKMKKAQTSKQIAGSLRARNPPPPEPGIMLGVGVGEGP